MNSVKTKDFYPASLARFWVFIPWLLLCGGSHSAIGGVHLSGSASLSSYNSILKKEDSTSASINLKVDLLTYLQIGITHKQSLKVSNGWNVDKETKLAAPYSLETSIKANSLDLTLILYPGEVFVPYLTGGVIVKEYVWQYRDAKTSFTSAPETETPAPNVGLGLGVRLNRQFSLKLLFTASPSEYAQPGEPAQAVWDQDSQVGISYKI